MKAQLKYYLLAQLSMAIIYHGTMWISPFQPATLPLTFFDNLIPYNDWFGAVYISFFFLLFYTVFYSAVQHSFACATAVIITAIAAGIVFICFPTVYLEKPAVQKPTFLLTTIKNYDSNYNCFPSVHVAVSVVCCYYACLQKSIFIKCVFTTWFLLLFVSVVVTQQHYFYDAVGGLVLGILVLVNSRRWHKYFSKNLMQQL
jgi:membrane-associated phospholipid phosphatase